MSKKDDQEMHDELNNEKKSEWAVADFLKRALLAGVGAVFMTEEGVRSFLGDMKLPKDAAQFVISQVSKTKEDLFRIVSHEIRSFLESTQLADELRRVLTSTSLEISAKVRFVDEGDSLQPRTKTSAKVTRRPKKKKARKSRKAASLQKSRKAATNAETAEKKKTRNA